MAFIISVRDYVARGEIISNIPDKNQLLAFKTVRCGTGAGVLLVGTGTATYYC